MDVGLFGEDISVVGMDVTLVGDYDWRGCRGFGGCRVGYVEW